jgi:hypothetical protein
MYKRNRFLLIAILLCVAAATPAAWAQTQVAKLVPADGTLEDHYGQAVAISGDVAAVGVQFNDAEGENAGAVYVYRRSGAAWPQEAKLTAGDAGYSDRFGAAVALAGDMLLVGAPEDDDIAPNSGAVYVFKCVNGVWTQRQKITAYDTQADALFGRQLNAAGDRVIIGTSGIEYATEFPIGAYVYWYNGSQWIRDAKLTPSAEFPTQLEDMSVAIAGDVAVVGAPYDDGLDRDCGSALVYRFSGDAWNFEQKLESPAPVKLGLFGRVAAVSDGTILVNIYVFRFSDGAWAQTETLPGAGPTLDFDQNVVTTGYPTATAAGVTNAGVAARYRYLDGAWYALGGFTAGDPAEWDNFGSAVAATPEYVIVGAMRDDDNGSNSGSAYVFAIGRCAGDLNGDHLINLDDLAQMLANYGLTSGATYAQGDLNQDGDIDLDDLAEMLSVYGDPCP